MNIPLVSTITPCFRMKKYLRTFLESLPEQTFFDQMEIVLDHNEPDSEEIEWVREFQEKYPDRIKHIITNPVDPIGVSMNRCISEASGKFLAIWNVDDLRVPDSIEKQAQLMLQKESIGVVYGDLVIVNTFGKKEGVFVDHSLYPRTEHTRGMIFGPFFMFKKSICCKSGYFDEQLKSGADFDLAIRIALHTKAATTRCVLGYYLNEGLGASTRPNSLQPVERTVIEMRYGIYDKIQYKYLCRALRYNIPYLLQFGSWRHVGEYVPDYEQFLTEREPLLYKGLKNYNRENRLELLKSSIKNSLDYLGLLEKVKLVKNVFCKKPCKSE